MLPKPNKRSIIQWCEDCGQGWVYAVKNRADGRLYCICTETETVWKSPEEMRKGKWVNTVPAVVAKMLPDLKDVLIADFTKASEEELNACDWTRPHNKLCRCPVCGDAYGWVVLKKDEDDHIVFVCDFCQSLWENAEDALKMRPTALSVRGRYTEVSREELCRRGFDRYDAVFQLNEEENS